MPVLSAGAGSRPACEQLSFASPKESHQRKGDPQSATPALRSGANLRRVGCGVRRGTHCAAMQLRSDIHGESVHEARALRRACHPTTAPPQAHPAGVAHPNSRTANIHSGHRCARPRLAGASATRCANWAERSDGPNGCWLFGCSAVPPLLAAPTARRLWGEHGRRSAHAS